jgi:hypothetical protein
MALAAVMPEVLDHRRPTLAQRQRQPVREVVAGRDAVREDRGLAQQEITADFVDHRAALALSARVVTSACQRSMGLSVTSLK